MSGKYEQHLPPEGINVGRTNVLAESVWLLGGFALSVATLVLMFYLAGALLARHLPFAWEIRVAEQMFRSLPNRDEAGSAHLQKLADRLAQGLVLPEGMRFRVIYVNDDEVNAYATLGGYIIMNRGLVGKLESENAIAMVLAHEMAHILHRDPADAAGGRLAVAMVMAALSGAIGIDGLGNMMAMTQNIALLGFSREAERRADETGVALVARHYGHLAGADEVFRELAADEGRHRWLAGPEILSTHPDTVRRGESLRREAERLDIPLTGKLTPVPAALRPGRE